jgi:Sulfotransferase domain
MVGHKYSNQGGSTPWNGRRLPTFIGIGPAHAGSTWLHWVLDSRAGLPRPEKETHFFDWHYTKGMDWYANHFAHCREDQPIGEICNYFPSRVACERIASDLPDCKIICSLRDPVDRAYSAYKFALYNGLTRDGFKEALRRTPAITVGNRYGFHLNQWYERFGKSRVLVVLFDEMRSNPQEYVRKVCEFLALPPIDVSSLTLPAKAYNSHSMKPRIPSLARKGRRAINWLGDRRMGYLSNLIGLTGVWRLCFDGRFPPIEKGFEAQLRDQYLPEIETLERISGLELSSWKSASL